MRRQSTMTSGNERKKQKVSFKWSLCGSLEPVCVFIAIVTAVVQVANCILWVWRCGVCAWNFSKTHIFHTFCQSVNFLRKNSPDINRLSRMTAIKSSYHILSHCDLYLNIFSLKLRWLEMDNYFGEIFFAWHHTIDRERFGSSSILYEEEEINAKQLKWKIFY